VNFRRQLALLMPGTRERRHEIALYADAWRHSNERIGSTHGPLWTVLGDSTGQGVGATSHDRGYVGLVRTWLEQRDGTTWRILNLSVSGARSADVVNDQLPKLGATSTAEPPSLVSCAIGANDLLRRTSGLEENLATIAAALPPGSLLANMPRGLRERRARGVTTSSRTSPVPITCGSPICGP